MRVSVLAVQSANVERVCEAHGAVHSKSRNRSKLRSVNMLLHCCVNLCLLKKDNAKIGEFLASAVLDEEEEAEKENENVIETIDGENNQNDDDSDQNDDDDEDLDNYDGPLFEVRD